MANELKTPGEQREAFLAAMTRIKEERREEVGGHGWRDYADTYGPEALFYELASIMHRLKLIFADTGYDPEKRVKARDLLVDLGNYAGFLYEYLDVE